MNEPSAKNDATTKWHTLEAQDILSKLDSEAHGLAKEERIRRLEEYGPNALPAPPVDSIFTIFIRQFKSPLIYLLLVATIILALLEEWVDVGIISFVILFNAVAGTIQAGRAQNTMLALQRITKTMATISVAGSLEVVEDITVVPGDIVVLREGDKVPADARLLTSRNLRVNESALTGEAKPSAKSLDAISAPDIMPAEQKNMVFKGTFVVAGTATAIITGTGRNTVIGGISEQISQIDTEIPLQVNIRKLSHIIIKVVLVISAFIFGLGVWANQPLEEMFALAIAVIVSAVPEGLPIVLTLLLATGVWRMGKQNVLVKRLQAVEALGEAKIIAVDKTGTITKNELAVTVALTSQTQYSVQASGFNPEGVVLHNDTEVDVNTDESIKRLGLAAALCAEAQVEQDSDTGLWDVHGDPTDGAMLVFAQKLQFTKTALTAQYNRIDEIPFDAATKLHAVLYGHDDGSLLVAAGAPESIIERSTHWRVNGELQPLLDADKTKLQNQVSEHSSQALRVIALAERTDFNGAELTDDSVQSLVLVGLLGMKDGLRSEVPEAMQRTREAGIKVVMITGDHKKTAQAIATEAGIFQPGDSILTNDDIDAMSEEELADAISNVTVFARITPEHKLSIVQAFRARGDIVAMTGDGVNDALSLVAADLGVAMGKRGTEVAKEAADLVLLDDNFGSIVSAVEEGRGIYMNLKKVLLFLFSTSLGEVMIIIIAIVLFLPAPVLAAQLIWINLVTDGVLDIGLALEPKEKGLMKRSFVRPNQFFFDGWMVQRMLLMSSVMAIGTLVVFIMYYENDLAKAMTMAVTIMVVCQWFKAWACRAEYRSVFQTNPFGNMFLFYATLSVIGLHIFAIYTPFMQNLLSLQPLSLFEWGIAIGIGALTLLVDEVRKFIRRNLQSTPA